MMVDAVKVPMSLVAKKITVEIRLSGMAKFSARLWLTRKFLALAALVSPVSINIITETNDDRSPPEHRGWTAVGDLIVPRAASVLDGPLYDETIFDWGPKVDVFLDGVKQDMVVSFDMDRGFVRIYANGPDGEPFVENDEVATRLLRGTVELKPRADG